MTKENPICVALDTTDVTVAVKLARSLMAHVGYLKIGMEFYYANGPKGYEVVAREGLPVFLDLKLHDIPNTVGSAIAALLRLSPVPAIVNVHAAGGSAMMKTAAEAVAGRTKLIAVTILTSLNDEDLRAIGFDCADNTATHALQLAKLTFEAGLQGVVCSPHETKAIRQATSRDFLTVVPGIRLLEGAAADQKRVSTPAAAIAAGADILVIGRPITGAPDPVRAAQNILASLHAG